MAANIPSPSPEKNQVSEPDVMGALKKQSSPKERMAAQDIVKHDCETNGSGNMSWNQIYAGLVEACKSNKYRIMRANNSLFCYSLNGQGTGEVHLITADDPKTLVDSFKQFDAAIKKAGFTKLTSKVTNPQILKVLQMAGVKFKQMQGQHVQGNKANPAIDIVMEV